MDTTTWPRLLDNYLSIVPQIRARFRMAKYAEHQLEQQPNQLASCSMVFCECYNKTRGVWKLIQCNGTQSRLLCCTGE